MPAHVRPSSRLEIALGRSLAACVHPEAAWRLGARGRIPMLIGYFLAGFLVMGLLTLLAGGLVAAS